MYYESLSSSVSSVSKAALIAVYSPTHQILEVILRHIRCVVILRHILYISTNETKILEVDSGKPRFTKRKNLLGSTWFDAYHQLPNERPFDEYLVQAMQRKTKSKGE
jgi:hypothetical protein